MFKDEEEGEGREGRWAVGSLESNHPAAALSAWLARQRKKDKPETGSVVVENPGGPVPRLSSAMWSSSLLISFSVAKSSAFTYSGYTYRVPE